MRIKYVMTIALALATLSLSAQKRIGMIGLDTSHSLEFTKIINSIRCSHPEMADFKVTAAYPYGSRTIPSSYERIPSYIDSMRSYGVEIAASIDELLKKVDFVLLETNDGNLHLEQAIQVIKAGKPMFIDKPMAGNLSDVLAIFELAAQKNVPLFSSSSLRYTANTQAIVDGKCGEVIGADSYGPDNREPSHGEFTWYGIHAVEALFAVMGSGCTQVSCASVPGTEVATGVWRGDRIGTFRANSKAKYVFGGTVFTAEGAFQMGSEIPYDVLLKHIVEFFRTGKVPVNPMETMEIFTFMEAAAQSKARGGIPVSTQEIFETNYKKALEIVKNTKL